MKAKTGGTASTCRAVDTVTVVQQLPGRDIPGERLHELLSGPRGAAQYSLVQTAKANGLEPYAYLRRVLTALPKATSLADIEALLPVRIAPSQLDINTTSP